VTIIGEPGKDIPKTIYDQLGTTKNDIQIQSGRKIDFNKNEKSTDV
jgi:hypothetical protein